MKKMNLWTKLILALSLLLSGTFSVNAQTSDFEVWNLEWRMFVNSMFENYELANSQFDSLLNLTDNVDKRFLTAGLEVKTKLNKNEEVIALLNSRNEDMLRDICIEQFLAGMEPCTRFSEEKVENKELQRELVRMSVEDQAVRGSMMYDMISKYNIDTTQIIQNDPVEVDERNRIRLKEIIGEYGFPTRKLVGIEAMDGVFLIIQHSDMDTEWQKSQLANIEAAVKNGDMEGQDYAYLYDRIQVNSGNKQLYGTQFMIVDFEKKTVEMSPTEDLENLDKRRMEFGMMPIKMYKELVQQSL